MKNCIFCLEDHRAGTPAFVRIHNIEQGISVDDLPSGFFVLQDIWPGLTRKTWYSKLAVLDHFLLISKIHVSSAAEYPDELELLYAIFTLIGHLQEQYPDSETLVFEHGGKKDAVGVITHMRIHFVVVERLEKGLYEETTIKMLARSKVNFDNDQISETPFFVGLPKIVKDNGYLHFGFPQRRCFTVLDQDQRISPQILRQALMVLEGGKEYDWQRLVNGKLPIEVQRDITRQIKRSRRKKLS